MQIRRHSRLLFFFLYAGPCAHHLRPPSSSRELLERFDEKINQELAVRAYKRELAMTHLDNLD